MGFGHRVYRAEDPRARVLRRVAQELGHLASRSAAALEQAALTELRDRRPDRPIETNVEFWAAIDPRLRCGSGAHVHGDVHLRPRGRLERAHPRAEAHRTPHPALGPSTSAPAPGPPTSVAGWDLPTATSRGRGSFRRCRHYARCLRALDNDSRAAGSGDLRQWATAASPTPPVQL